jgi:hypothetical protein
MAWSILAPGVMQAVQAKARQQQQQPGAAPAASSQADRQSAQRYAMGQVRSSGVGGGWWGPTGVNAMTLGMLNRQRQQAGQSAGNEWGAPIQPAERQPGLPAGGNQWETPVQPEPGPGLSATIEPGADDIAAARDQQRAQWGYQGQPSMAMARMRQRAQWQRPAPEWTGYGSYGGSQAPQPQQPMAPDEYESQTMRRYSPWARARW